MNSRIYTFGNLGNEYSQYPADYTSDIFLNFYKQTTQKSQIIIHREGSLMYYGYIRTLNQDSQYIGFCVVVNGIMFSNIAKLFPVFENAVSDMVSRGNILLLDDNGDLLPQTDSLSQHEKEIKRTAAIIRVNISDLENSVKKLPPIDLDSTKDESYRFSVSDKNDDIVEASTKCGYTCVFKNIDSGAASTDSHNAASDESKEHSEELTMPRVRSNSKRRYWPLVIVFLSVFGTLLCMDHIRRPKNKAASSTDSVVVTHDTFRSNLPKKTEVSNKATPPQEQKTKKTAPSQEVTAKAVQEPQSSAKNISKTESTPTDNARKRDTEVKTETKTEEKTEKKPSPDVRKEETAPQPAQPTPKAIDPNKIYYSYDIDAEFPGGKKARKKWLNDNISWPTDNSGNILHGDVELEFVVERDGRISNVKVTDSENPMLNSEAIRLIGSMPKWAPALLNNQPVRSAVSLTLFF